MMGELGHLCLIVAWMLSLLQSVALYIYPKFKLHEALVCLTKRFPVSHCLLYTASLLTLFWALYSNDFSLQYVAANSNTHLLWYYRLCALWGAHEGSLLLWCWLLSLLTLIVTRERFCHAWSKQYRVKVVSYIAMVNAGLTGFILLTSNPFLRYLPHFPSQGRDLNPLLQDPGMIAHPPILYSGYVGYVIVFAMAMAALSKDHYEQRWIRWVTPWSRIAWSWLTLGIVLGSWWAYRELGWGGFWGWDPVENASFLPWLMGTALLHLQVVNNKSRRAQISALLVAMSCFILSLLGTFLVRSGVIVSVHAFAQDPSRGIGLLLLLTVVLFLVLTKFFMHSKKVFELAKQRENLRHVLLWAQAILFSLATCTVLLGTLYPMFSQIFFHESLSVGAPYFNSVMLPQVVLGLLLMVFLIGSMGVKSEEKSGILGLRIWLELLVSTLASLVFFWILGDSIDYMAWLMLSLILWVMVVHFRQFIQLRKQHSMSISMLLGHLGFLVFLLGVLVCSQLSQEKLVRMKVGDEVHLVGKSVQLKHIKTIRGPNYQGYRGEFEVYNQSGRVLTLKPEQRMYQPRGMMLPKVSIIKYIWGDLYLALGREMPDHYYIVRVYARPLVRLIWLGGLIMLGALFYALLAGVIRKRLKFWRSHVD